MKWQHVDPADYTDEQVMAEWRKARERSEAARADLFRAIAWLRETSDAAASWRRVARARGLPFPKMDT